MQSLWWGRFHRGVLTGAVGPAASSRKAHSLFPLWGLPSAPWKCLSCPPPLPNSQRGPGLWSYLGELLDNPNCCLLPTFVFTNAFWHCLATGSFSGSSCLALVLDFCPWWVPETLCLSHPVQDRRTYNYHHPPPLRSCWDFSCRQSWALLRRNSLSWGQSHHPMSPILGWAHIQWVIDMGGANTAHSRFFPSLPREVCPRITLLGPCSPRPSHPPARIALLWAPSPRLLCQHQLWKGSRAKISLPGLLVSKLLLCFVSHGEGKRGRLPEERREK